MHPRASLVFATIGLLLCAAIASAQSVVYKPVKVDPQTRDDHTLLLATFDTGTDRADFARGDAALKVANVVSADGVSGKAALFDKGGQISVSPENNLLPAAGTIEMVIKDANPTLRHPFVSVGDGVNPTRWMWLQFDAGMWWMVNGSAPWIHDISIREDFPRKWFYAVLGWDTQRGKVSLALYDMEGRLHRNQPQYFQTAPMPPEKARELAAAAVKTISFGSPGVLLDTLRISDIYRADLLEPERDWGPVEQWSNYSGANRLFDETTLVRAWTAGAATPGVPAGRVVKVAPVIRDAKYQPTEQTKPPVDAVRCSPGAPVWDLDFGALDVSCYVVRVIAMARTGDIEKHRKPVYVDLSVNDKPGGGTSVYRHRVPYWDDFYAVTELYFNADEKRAYRATLAAGQGSLTDLYIHRIELHNVLGGLPGVAAKQRTGLFTPDEREQLRKNSNPNEVWEQVRRNVPLESIHRPGAAELDAETRRARDDRIWNAMPPINSQFVAEYDETGVVGSEMAPAAARIAEVKEKFGEWALQGSSWLEPFHFANAKLEKTWSPDDLAAHRPLPDPYPLKSDGSGVYIPKTGDMAHAVQYFPLAAGLGQKWQNCWAPFAGWHGEITEYRLPYLYHALGQRNAARDAALLLCKWAYVYPTHTDAQTLGYATVAPASMYNRDMRLRIRALMFYWGSPRGASLQNGLAIGYDYLYDFIQGNQELAQAVGRYIPWVKTDEDVRRLIETRILQFGARQSLNYHLIDSKSHSVYLLRNAVVQQDPQITRPWMESLWRRTHIYPHPDAGLPSYVSTTTQRDGTTDIGSRFYTWDGTPFLKTVAMTRRYVANGGDPKFDLSDFGLYGKIPTGCAFPLDSAVAGGYPLTIGDVGGPAQPRLFGAMSNFEDTFRYGWEWTGDPRFAWIVKHYYGRRQESDADWQRVEEAAAKQGRNPFLAQDSRVMANWAGILESGRDSDDYRFKRTAYLRTGMGHGHAHNDTLDLQYLALGCRMLNDLGHRGSYNQPRAGDTILHNRIESDGIAHPNNGNWQGHGWIDTLVATPGAQYMHGTAVPPGNHSAVRSYTRAVALVDAGEGQAVTPPHDGIYKGEATRHAAAAVAPSGYLFDVQRMSGGATHTYCFHGCWSDDFAVNMTGRADVIGADRAAKEDVDAMYLRKFLDGPGLKYAGNAPADGSLIATWRLRRDETPIVAGDKTFAQGNAEKLMLGADYDETAPRKFTRLHLFNTAGHRVMVAAPTPQGPDYAGMAWPFLMVQDRTPGDAQESVYPAIIEAYSGEPFIVSVTPIAIANNGPDANRAVALKVRLANGREDICFDEGRYAGKDRRVDDALIVARHAIISRNSDGLRLLQMVEGDEIGASGVFIKSDASAWAGKIVRVDYPSRKVWLQGNIPAAVLDGAVIEIGNDQHKTSFTAVAAQLLPDGLTVITLDKSIDLSYAEVRQVNPVTKDVWTNIGPTTVAPGAQQGYTCTNADMSKSWKCDIAGQDRDKGYRYRLQGDVTEADLPIESSFRLWEFGVGDSVRLPTYVQLRRVGEPADQEYELRANTRLSLVSPQGCRILHADGAWRELAVAEGTAEMAARIAHIRLSDLEDGVARIRLK